MLVPELSQQKWMSGNNKTSAGQLGESSGERAGAHPSLYNHLQLLFWAYRPWLFWNIFTWSYKIQIIYQGHKNGVVTSLKQKDLCSRWSWKHCRNNLRNKEAASQVQYLHQHFISVKDDIYCLEISHHRLRWLNMESRAYLENGSHYLCRKSWSKKERAWKLSVVKLLVDWNFLLDTFSNCVIWNIFL